MRRDDSKKPSYEALHKLIKKEWWTEGAKIASNGSGSFEFTGFLGEYDITLGDRKIHFNLDKNDKPLKIVL